MQKLPSAKRTWLSLAACLIAWPSVAQDLCWPTGAKPGAPTASLSGEAPAPGPTVVYFDGSGSMAGYARAPTKGAGAESHYRSLALLLPQTLAAGSATVDYYEFGKKTAADKTEFLKLTDAQLQQLTKPTYYCGGLNGEGACRYQDSPIADALNRIVEQPPNALGIVVSDLFLSNSELVGIGGRELQLPLTKALREGRAIALLAIKAASTGPIYDITQIEKNQCFSRERGLENCNKNAPQYTGATSRPLFIVMIGPTERILQFKRKLDSDLLRGIDERDQRFTIFTKQGVGARDTDAWPHDAFAPLGKANKANVLGVESFPGQQFLLNWSGEGLQADVDFDRRWTPGVPGPAKLLFEVSSWYRLFRGKDKDACGWLAHSAEDTNRLIQFERIGPLKIRVRVAHPSPRIAGMLSRVDGYLVSGKVSAAGFRSESWFDEWGYNELDELKVLERKPTFFPAKNLPRIGKVLSDILQENAETVGLGEFRLGLKVH